MCKLEHDFVDAVMRRGAVIVRHLSAQRISHYLPNGATEHLLRVVCSLTKQGQDGHYRQAAGTVRVGQDAHSGHDHLWKSFGLLEQNGERCTSEVAI